jgi:hypothetical protein
LYPDAAKSMNTCYAHSLTGRPPSEWQTLTEHQKRSADLGAEHARAFCSSEWCRLLGLLHDVGKTRNSFQNYLRTSKIILDAAPWKRWSGATSDADEQAASTDPVLLRRFSPRTWG